MTQPMDSLRGRQLLAVSKGRTDFAQLLKRTGATDAEEETCQQPRGGRVIVRIALQKEIVTSKNYTAI